MSLTKTPTSMIDTTGATSGQLLAYDGTKWTASGSQSLANPGYVKLPNGLIIQWGTVTTAANGNATVTWPIAFPNAVLTVTANADQASTAYVEVASYSTVLQTTTQGLFLAAYWNGSAWTNTTLALGWIAIGY